MAESRKSEFLKDLTRRYGAVTKLTSSYSLYQLCDGTTRVYIRYSRVHGGERTFYGLREEDLQQLQGHASILCFLWDEQTEPLLVPFSEFEDIFQSVEPAGDGQYKAQIYLSNDGTELYIARAGRFNVEGYFGWGKLDAMMDSSAPRPTSEFSHSQMQTLVGAIGTLKGYDIWVPPSDRPRLDWSVAYHFDCRDVLSYGFEQVQRILQEVDVIWVKRGSSELRALFEIEHSTPIYSGLLRFNDIHLVAPTMRPRFSVVAANERHVAFVRQLNRPTFQLSGLSDLCTFLEYSDVFRWYNRIRLEREV